MNQIKIIRLVDGEDIVTSFEQLPNGNIIAYNPMTLFFKRMTSERSIVLMNPWLPLELIENDVAEILSSQIMSIIEPKASLIDYYLKYVEEYTVAVEDSAKAIDEALKAPFEESDRLEDEYESILQESLLSLSKNKIH